MPPAPTGPRLLDRRGALHLTVAARSMCAISPGTPVVLAASVPEQTLVIYPAAVVAPLLAAPYGSLLGGRDEH